MKNALQTAREKYAQDVEDIEVDFDKRRSALKRRHAEELQSLQDAEDRALDAARAELRIAEVDNG